MLRRGKPSHSAARVVLLVRHVEASLWENECLPMTIIPFLSRVYGVYARRLLYDTRVVAMLTNVADDHKCLAVPAITVTLPQ